MHENIQWRLSKMGPSSPHLYPEAPAASTGRVQLMGLDEDFFGDFVDPEFVEFFENNETYKKVCLE